MLLQHVTKPRPQRPALTRAKATTSTVSHEPDSSLDFVEAALTLSEPLLRQVQFSCIRSFKVADFKAADMAGVSVCTSGEDFAGRAHTHTDTHTHRHTHTQTHTHTRARADTHRQLHLTCKLTACRSTHNETFAMQGPCAEEPGSGCAVRRLALLLWPSTQLCHVKKLTRS